MSAMKMVTRFAMAILAAVLLGAAVASADDDTTAERQKMKELGLKYDSAWAMCQALKEQANGGQILTWQHVPDWGGVYSRTKGGQRL